MKINCCETNKGKDNRLFTSLQSSKPLACDFSDSLIFCWSIKKMEREVTQPVTLETEVKDQMLATIYGQAVGDAIGLLTEFMTKDEAIEVIQ